MQQPEQAQTHATLTGLTVLLLRAFKQRRGSWATTLVHALVVVLAFTLGSAGALPLWAQLAGVEGPHVCHCSTEKHDCLCAKCHTDVTATHDVDEEMLLSSESMKGRCGDDDVAFAGKAIVTILAAPAMARLANPSDDLLPIDPLIDPDLAARAPPPTPPPRPLSSRG